MKFEFTEKMNEISGIGGAHERALRAGVSAGARWFEEHQGATPFFVEGAIPRNADAAALLGAIIGTQFVADDGTRVALAEVLSPFMRYAILFHTAWIGANGWDNYVRAMTSPFNFYDTETHSEQQ